MLSQAVLLLVAGTVLITVIGCYLALRREDAAAAIDVGAEPMALPPSLHPVIDLEVCIGSTGCVDVCPELLLHAKDGRTFVHPVGDCVGHGRCEVACPVDAIRLVFGTAERGVDLPRLRAGYETNVDGLFIAGELGGMGLIRNAMTQGLKAIDSVPKALARPDVVRREDPDLVDVVIVGAGPAGLAAALNCTAQGLSHTIVDQYTVGGSVAHYPRRKVVFSEAFTLPLVGRIGKQEISKEELMAEFEGIVRAGQIQVREGRRVTAIEGRVGDFRVTCETPDGSETHRGRTVVLAIGRRGTPRQLGVPGEDAPHVVYRLIDPEQYRHRKVLCVGGGDSAVEAAVALAEVAGCEAHISYRRGDFSRAKSKNQKAIERMATLGQLALHLETEVQAIRPGEVELTGPQGVETLAIDDVIVNVGGVLPTPFLESIGVEIQTKFGEA